MFSKRELEGYLLIDHRNSMGFTEAEARKVGLDGLPVGPHQRLETATINCSHCQRMVILNPDRSRSRGYCPKCDHYLCDQCEAERVRTGICRPWKQVMDEALEQAVKGILCP